MVVFLCSELCELRRRRHHPGRRRHRLLLIDSPSPMEFNLADLWEARRRRDPRPRGDRAAATAASRTPRPTSAPTGSPTTSRSHGIGPGDHVALYLYNGTEYLEGMLAAFKLRAVPINVNYRYVEEELRYLLDDCRRQGDRVPPRVRARSSPRSATTCRCSRTFVVVDDELAAHDARRRSARPSYEARARGGVARARLRAALRRRPLHPLHRRHHRDAEGRDVARRGHLLRRARRRGLGGAPITHARADRRARSTPAGACLPACPFMHGTAHWFAFGTLYGGGTVVISPDRHFDPRAPLAAHRARAGRRSSSSSATRSRARSSRRSTSSTRRLDLSSLTVVLSGGAILSPTVKAAWVERAARHAPHRRLRLVGVGRAGPERRRRRRRDRDRAALQRERRDHGARRRPAAGAPSASSASSPAAATCPLGYYKDPEKTAATFPVVDGVRWSVPGDHARIEDDGTITVLGRGSVSINTGGEKVYPEEVEAALKSHPAVFDAVVVGVPDERWGERVVAVVQPRPGATPHARRARRARARPTSRATRRRATSCWSTRSCARRRASPTTAGRAPPRQAELERVRSSAPRSRRRRSAAAPRCTRSSSTIASLSVADGDDALVGRSQSSMHPPALEHVVEEDRARRDGARSRISS